MTVRVGKYKFHLRVAIRSINSISHGSEFNVHLRYPPSQSYRLNSSYFRINRFITQKRHAKHSIRPGLSKEIAWILPLSMNGCVKKEVLEDLFFSFVLPILTQFVCRSQLSNIYPEDF